MYEEKKGKKEYQEIETDWFLQYLVDLTNQGAITCGITLNIGGFLISGILVSGKDYFEGFAEEISSGYRDEKIVESLRKAFGSFAKKYDRIENPEEKRPFPHYIHLKEARFFNTSGNPLPGNRAVWWRGRISQVQGFILGLLSQEQTAQ